MKSKIKQILNTITPQDLEEGCSRQVEEIEKLFLAELLEKAKEKNLTLGISINNAIGGYLFKGGDIEDIPEILFNMSEEYKESILEQQNLAQNNPPKQL